MMRLDDRVAPHATKKYSVLSVRHQWPVTLSPNPEGCERGYIH